MPLRALLLCATLLLLQPVLGRGLASAHDTVLVVHSYNPEYVWTQQINQGLREALRGLEVELAFFYMDAKRGPDPERLRQSGLEALALVEATRPRLVITVDDAAQEYLAAPHLRGRNAPQVVFCGVNAPLAKYGYPADNVSGVRERWHFRDGFRLLKEAAPRVKSAVFLVDDSESGRYVADDLRAELKKGGPMAVRVAAVETVATYQQWQRRVLAWKDKADALAMGLYHSLTDEATGRVVAPEQVMAWTAKASPVPSLGFSDAARDHGLLCGVLESGHEQGLLAGTMAREALLSGTPVGRQAVRINTRGVVLLNLKTAQRLGLMLPFGLIESAGVVVQ